MQHLKYILVPHSTLKGQKWGQSPGGAFATLLRDPSYTNPASIWSKSRNMLGFDSYWPIASKKNIRPELHKYDTFWCLWNLLITGGIFLGCVSANPHAWLQLYTLEQPSNLEIECILPSDFAMANLHELQSLRYTSSDWIHFFWWPKFKF